MIDEEKLAEFEERLEEIQENYNNTGCVSFANYGLSEEHILKLAKAFQDNTYVYTLDLSQNNMRDKETVVLAEVLEKKNVRTLYLYRNFIGDKGAVALAKNKNLEKMILWDNKIGAEGAKAYGENLKNNFWLKELCLNDNKIGDEGIKAIAEGLKENNVLRKLYLRGTSIEDAGANAIIDALKVNNNIGEINLSSNNFPHEYINRVNEMLNVNNSLYWTDYEKSPVLIDIVKELKECRLPRVPSDALINRASIKELAIMSIINKRVINNSSSYDDIQHDSKDDLELLDKKISKAVLQKLSDKDNLPALEDLCNVTIIDKEKACPIDTLIYGFTPFEHQKFQKQMIDLYKLDKKKLNNIPDSQFKSSIVNTINKSNEIKAMAAKRLASQKEGK